MDSLLHLLKHSCFLADDSPLCRVLAFALTLASPRAVAGVDWDVANFWRLYRAGAALCPLSEPLDPYSLSSLVGSGILDIHPIGQRIQLDPSERPA